MEPSAIFVLSNRMFQKRKKEYWFSGGEKLDRNSSQMVQSKTYKNWKNIPPCFALGLCKWIARRNKVNKSNDA